MMEFQRAARMSARQTWKVATEMTSFMQRFIYVEKEKMFNIVTYDVITM